MITNFRELLTNLVPEAIGIFFTVVFIDRISKMREKQNQEQEYKQQLVRDAGSTSNEIAKNALHQMHKRDWVRGDDNLLQGQNYRASNWRRADLWKANLTGSDLQFVNLHDAYVYSSNLSYTDLCYGRLIRTDLRGTNLKGANMHHADLTDAILSGTSVNGKYRSASFDENTILPDGTYWSSETDLSRFGVVFDYRANTTNVSQNSTRENEEQ